MLDAGVLTCNDEAIVCGGEWCRLEALGSERSRGGQGVGALPVDVLVNGVVMLSGLVVIDGDPITEVSLGGWVNVKLAGGTALLTDGEWLSDSAVGEAW